MSSSWFWLLAGKLSYSSKGSIDAISPHGVLWASSQHGDQVSRASVSRKKTRWKLYPFYDLALEVTHHHLCRALWDGAVTSSCLCSREENIEPTSQWEECQLHCKKRQWFGKDQLIDWHICKAQSYTLLTYECSQIKTNLYSTTWISH